MKAQADDASTKLVSVRCAFAAVLHCHGESVCNRRQTCSDIRMELWSYMRISGDHLIRAVTYPQANYGKRNIVSDQEWNTTISVKRGLRHR